MYYVRAADVIGEVRMASSGGANEWRRRAAAARNAGIRHLAGMVKPRPEAALQRGAGLGFRRVVPLYTARVISLGRKCNAAPAL